MMTHARLSAMVAEALRLMAADDSAGLAAMAARLSVAEVAQVQHSIAGALARHRAATDMRLTVQA